LNLPSIKIDGKFKQNFYVKWRVEDVDRYHSWTEYHNISKAEYHPL